MRLLDRYLLIRLAGPLLYCLAGFLIFWISFDLFASLGKLQEAHLGLREVLEYYWIKVPELLVLVLPVALLLSLLFTLTNLSKAHELIAMRGAGLSIWRLAVPYLMTGLCAGALVYYLNEFLVPSSLARLEDLVSGQKQSTAAWQNNVHFRNAREGRIWNVASYNETTHEMRNPHIEWRMPSGTNVILIARYGVRTNGVWTFDDVDQIVYSPGPGSNFPVQVHYDSLLVREFTETADDIKLQMKFHRMNSLDATKAPQLSMREIHYLRGHLQLNAKDQARLQTLYQYRLATPWTCIVVVLIALPFGFSSGRRNIFVGVASSIGICFLFFVLMRLGLALGTSGKVAPWLGAWLPNLFFTCSSVWLTQRIR